MVSLQPVSGLDDSQRDLFAGYVEVYAASGRSLFGDEHTAWGADELREMERSPNRRTVAAAAVQPDGEVVGSVSVVLRTRENPRVAFLSLAVHPEHRRRGVGSDLLRWAEARAVEHGRSVFIAETEWPAGGTDVSGETFARGHGYAPAQRVLRSTLPLPVDSAMLAGLGEGRGDASTPDYVLETSLDGIPEAWLEDRAGLQRRMSTRRAPRRPPARGGGLGHRPCAGRVRGALRHGPPRGGDRRPARPDGPARRLHPGAGVAGDTHPRLPAGHPGRARAPRPRFGPEAQGRQHRRRHGAPPRARPPFARGTPTTTPTCSP